ncbi:DcaP family trimeric outer membrane transporter [Candidatus Pelagadaptatus aseana]|uniref:DcaP family trimeric outer membrane transporter n=1 Tax=Candidatus Pelagadaptatus aseana TaxID=3120508 RepID=UPI003C6F65EC
MSRKVDFTTDNDPGADKDYDDETENLTAFSVSGKYAFENGNDLKFMYTTGNPGRYLALGTWEDAYVDGSDLKALDVDGWYIAYKHKWNSKWRSNFVYAASEADNPLDGDSTESIYNANINLIYSPTPKMSLGAEYVTGEKELKNGDDGDATRVQFTAKYAW